MKTKAKYLFLFFILFQFSNCNDIIDKNISNVSLRIQTPPDNYVSSTYNILFWWDTLNGASNYHLQIVQPSFDTIQQLIVDTLITGNKFTFPLYPGRYQWRLRAENNTSTTPYITRNIVIDSNSNFNGQSFNVLYPTNQYNSNDSIVNFSWQSFPFATSYEYVLLDNNSTVIKTETTAQTSLYDTLTEGGYYWQVRAINGINNTSTNYSTPRSLIIDLTPPAPAIPLTPANNSIDSNAVTLTWSHDADVYADSILIATDSAFQNIQYSYYLINNTSYQLEPLPLNERFYWRLRSRDQAGNWSTYSSTFNFMVQF